MSIMRDVCILSLTLLVGLLAGCSTPTNTGQNKEVEADVLAALKDFQSSYNQMNSDLIAGHFNNPTTLIGPKGLSITISKEDFKNTFDPVINHLEISDYASSEWKNLEVKILDEDLAIASADITQYDVNKEVIENFGATYTLSHDGDSWKISTITTHPPSDYKTEE